MFNTETSDDAEADLAWAAELLERIRAIDERRPTGIPCEDAIREAAQPLDR